MLELLEQIANGEDSTGGELHRNILDAVLPAFPIYAGLLQYGSDNERELCVELVLLCAKQDPSLRPVVEYFLNALRSCSDASGKTREYANRRFEFERCSWRA